MQIAHGTCDIVGRYCKIHGDAKLGYSREKKQSEKSIPQFQSFNYTLCKVEVKRRQFFHHAKSPLPYNIIRGGIFHDLKWRRHPPPLSNIFAPPHIGNFYQHCHDIMPKLVVTPGYLESGFDDLLHSAGVGLDTCPHLCQCLATSARS